MITKRQIDPGALGIEDVDMQAVVNTKYTSNILDVRQHFNYTAIITITETGAPTVGDAKLTVRVIGNDPDETILYERDVVTGLTTIVDTSAAAQANIREVVTFGAGNASVADPATVGTNAEIFKLAERIQLVLEITTVNDGTTSTASVTLLMGS
jgi:hypothetical protein